MGFVLGCCSSWAGTYDHAINGCMIHTPAFMSKQFCRCNGLFSEVSTGGRVEQCVDAASLALLGWSSFHDSLRAAAYAEERNHLE